MLVLEHLPVPYPSLAAVLVDAVAPSVAVEGEEELEAEAFDEVGCLLCGSRWRGRLGQEACGLGLGGIRGIPFVKCVQRED